MPTITTHKRVIKEADVVVLSRKEYERLLTSRFVPEFRPSAAEKKDLARARKNRASGNFLTIDELTRENRELQSAMKAILAGELALRKKKTRTFREFLSSRSANAKSK